MLPQEDIIDRIRRLADVDERVVAAMLYGSFTTGDADRFSDIDCIIFIDDKVSAQFDRPGWVSRVAPVALFFRNEFGNYATIFEDLIRAEFHFYPAGDIPAKIKSWQGDVFFPSLDATILVDKTGALTHHLQALIGPPPGRDTPQDARFLINSFLNWTLFGFNVLARGEFPRSSEILHLLQDYLLRMARLQEGTTHHWITPTRAAEKELSPTAYAQFTACTAAVEPEALWKAYLAAWEWGQSLLSELIERHELDRPEGLVNSLNEYVQSLDHSR